MPLRTALLALVVAGTSGCALSVPRDALAPSQDVGTLTASVRRPDRVRFAAVGDFGRDSPVQREVAKGVHRACADDCDFTVLLGDNLYWEGLRPESLEADRATLRCILQRYPGAKYPVLGNHDYHPVFTDPERAAAQLELFGEEGDDLFGGFHFYRLDAGLVQLFAIDTNLLVRGERALVVDDRIEAFGRSIEESQSPWTVAFGHHPIFSNGHHGDAGAFLEGDTYSLWSGEAWRRFFVRYVAGRAQLYLSDHDHNLQFFGRAFGVDTALAISGAGSEATPRSLDPSHDDAMMERYGHGFAIVEATPERMTVTYHHASGEVFWRSSRAPHGRWEGRRSVDPRHHRAEERAELRRRDAGRGCP